MDLMAFMEMMGTSNIPLLAAFFIGLMTALSPCPLATNITAIAAISRKMGKAKHTLAVGFAYTFGRAATYAGIASLVVWAGLNTQAVSFFLQQYGAAALGPFLIVVGIFLSGIVSLPSFGGSRRMELVKEKISEKGIAGAFLLGVIFALAFCPFSAVLFFGMLIPLALVAQDGVVIPSVFALGTGLPVIIMSLALSKSVSWLGNTLGKISAFEKGIRGIVSVVFILVGVYYLLISI